MLFHRKIRRFPHAHRDRLLHPPPDRLQALSRSNVPAVHTRRIASDSSRLRCNRDDDGRSSHGITRRRSGKAHFTRRVGHALKHVWNPFRTKTPLPPSDQMRLRQLERDFEILAADVETCITTIPKIHAKLRMRATRAAQAEEDPSAASSSATPSSSDQLPLSLSPSRQSLRDLARQRGFLHPQRPAQQGEQ